MPKENAIKIRGANERERERESKRLRRFITTLLLIFSLILQNFLFLASPVFAASKTWDFSSSSDYTFNSSKIEISSEQAQLKATSNWYNTSWGYRRTVTINNSGNSNTLTDYPVLLSLTSSNFSFSKAKSAGEDLRLTSSNGTTLINYWIQSYDSSAQTATVWVRVPTITASTTTTIYIYYGNSSATASTNGDGVFRAYENYDSDNTNFSYGTIAQDASWYSYNPPPQGYGSPAGLFFTSTRPQAIRYNGTNNRTYIVYGGQGSPQGMNITYYDHNTGTVATKVKVDDNPCGTDAHGNPSLAIDSSGYIYVFYGSETCAFKMKKSTNPEDISSWGTAVTISAANEEYPQPLFIGNTLYVFYRHKVSDSPYIKSFGYRTSTDNGSTWSSYNEIINFGAPTNIYAVVKRGNESPTPSIHISWTKWRYVSTADNDYLNTYYTYSDDGGTTWRKKDGTALTLPMDASTSDSVLTSGTDDNWPLDIQLDSSNNPYILNIVGTRNSDSDHRGTFAFKFHKWNGSAWTTVTIASGSDHLFDRGALRAIDANNFKAYLTLGGQTGYDGGEIQEYSSTDAGATWSKTTDTTSSSTYQHNYPKIVDNSSTDLQVIWGYGDSEPTSIFGYGSAGTFVTSSSFTFSGAGQEVFSSGGGSTTRANSRVEVSTNGASYIQHLIWSTSLPTNVRYQKIRFNSYSVGNAYRFMPLQYVWQKTGLSATSTWALSLFWYSAGLLLSSTPTNGGTVTNTVLTTTTPIANTWYTIEMWQTGTSTHIKVIKESDGSTIYDNSVTTNDYSSATLYAAFGQYAGSSPGTITGYYDDWVVRQYSSPEPSTSAASETTLYPTDNPSINPTSANAQAFTSLSAFSETATKNGGQIKYQVSNDSGTTWYWWNGLAWATTTSGYAEASLASAINSNISTLPLGSKSLLFKAYLNSDGTQLVQLDSVNLTYINDITAPTISAVSAGTPTSTGATVTWTTNEDSSSKVDYGLTNSYGSSTTETDTPTGVTSHSVALSSLTTCTTYHYRVRSIDAALNETIDSDNTFITTGCTSSSTSSNNNSSSTSTSVCSDTAPGAKAPWLYGAIAQDSGSVLLYFTEADNPVNKYVLEYGTKSGDYPYGVQDMGVNSRGQMTFLVKSLSPNTTYYFKVRGGNGCATGTWSNEISAKTKGLLSFNQLEITQSELEPQPVTEIPSNTSCQTYTVKSGDTLWSIAKTLLGDGNKYKEIIEQNKDVYSSLETSNNLRSGWELKINCGKQATTETQKTPETQSGYDVKVKVVDTDKKPVEGASVTLHSTPQTTITDKNGVASFKNVEAGDHKVLIAYNNFEGEQSINLTGDVKEFDLNVTVQQKAISLSPLAYGIIGIMGLVIIGLIVLLIKNKRKE